MDIGNRIKKARLNKQINQENLATSIGISQGNLSSMENNIIRPSLETLIKINEVLDVSIDWLLTGKQINTSLQKNEIKILDLYRALNDKDQIKIEGIMEEKLKEQFE